VVLAIILVVLALLVVGGVLFLAYRLISRLPHDHGNEKDDGKSD